MSLSSARIASTKVLSLLIIASFLGENILYASNITLKARRRAHVIQDEAPVRRGGGDDGANLEQAEAAQADYLALQQYLQNFHPAAAPEALVQAAGAPAMGYAAEALNWIQDALSNANGLARSYPQRPGYDNQAYTYDQAIAGYSLIEDGELVQAKQIFEFFVSQWDGTGFFTLYNADPTSNESNFERLKILGPNAWIGLFALRFYMTTSDVRGLDLAKDIVSWARTLPVSNGGRAMGVNTPGDNPNYGTIYSVENNLSYYGLLKNLSAALANSTDSDKDAVNTELAAVKGWLKTEGYNPSTGLFRRGANDTTLALDTNTWAIMALGVDTLTNDFGINVASLVQRIELNFAVNASGSFGTTVLTNYKGFDFSDVVNAGNAGRTGVVWSEGTEQMIAVYDMLASYYTDTGNSTQAAFYTTRRDHFIAQQASRLIVNSQGNSGLRYTDAVAAIGKRAFHDDPNVLITNTAALAATSWSYLARQSVNPFLVTDELPADLSEARTRFLELIQNSGYINEITQFFNVTFYLGDGLSWNFTGNRMTRREEARLDAFKILRDEMGRFRPDPIGGVIAIIQFKAAVSTHPNRTQIESALSTIFGINLNNITPDAYEEMVTNGLLYDSNGFKRNAAQTVDFIFKVQSLHQGIISNATQFQSLFNISPAEQNFSNEAYKDRVFEIASQPNFDPAAFLAVMTRAANLLNAIRVVSGTPIAADLNRDGMVDRADLAIMISNYGLASAATAAQGDLNGDGRINLQDIVALQRQYGSTGGGTAADLIAFNNMFGINLQVVGAITGTQIKTIFDIAGDPNFVQTEFIRVLRLANSLLVRLRSEPALLTVFNTVYQTTVPLTGKLNIHDRTEFFNITGSLDDPMTPANEAYNEAALVSALQNIGSFASAIQSNESYRQAFNRVFGTSISAGPISTADRAVLFEVMFQPGFDQFQFLTVLIKADNLLIVLQSSGTGTLAADLNADGVVNRADLAILVSNYGRTSGATAAQGDLNGDGRISLQDVMILQRSFGQTGGGSAATRAAFNALFGTNIPAAGTIPISSRKPLFDLVGDPDFNQVEFLRVLPAAAALLTALRETDAYRQAYNTVYSMTLTASGALTDTQRAKLFDIAGPASFLLSPYLTALRDAADLLIVLRTDSVVRNRYNQIFNPDISASGVLTDPQIASLFERVSADDFDLNNFLGALPAVQALHQALAAHRDHITTLYGISAADQNNSTDAYLMFLFSLTGDPDFNQSEFIRLLPKAAALLTAIRVSTTRNQYNFLFNANISLAALPTPEEVAQLFSIVAPVDIPGTPANEAYDQTVFLSVVPKAYDLVRTIRLNYLADYNALFDPDLAASGNLNDAQRTRIMGLAGTDGFSVQTFAQSLPKVNMLWSAIRDNATNRTSFNLLYNYNLSASSSMTDTLRQDFFDIVFSQSPSGQPYDLNTFISVLNKAYQLVRDLRLTSAKLSAYNTIFDPDVPASGNIGILIRSALMDRVADPNYDHSAFMNALIPVRDLQIAMNTSALKSAFADLYGISSINQLYTNANYVAFLFGIVSGANYSQLEFIRVLPLAAALLSSLTGNNARRIDFNALYGVNYVVGQPLPDAIRTKLFDIAGASGFTVNKYNEFIDAIHNYKAYYDSMTADRRQSADYVLAALGLNLRNGLDNLDLIAFADPDRGILYDGPVLRVVPDVFDYQVRVGRFYREFLSLNSADRGCVDRTLQADHNGLRLADGLQIHEIGLFGSILYQPEPVDPVDALYNILGVCI